MTSPARAGRILLFLAALCPCAGAAQLRPIEPVPWDALSSQGPMLRIGLGRHAGARASLAGIQGTLTELGIYTGAWTLGRVAVEIGGVVMRRFSDDSVYASPVADARAPNGEGRFDTGEHRLATTILLTPATSAVDVVMRFGTRLPTTDNVQGLGRDQTDFFGGFGARIRRGSVEAAGEAGIGILSTRLTHPEQVDVLLYGARIGWGRERARLWLETVGQHDTRKAAELRGLEDLSEARLVGEVGADRVLRVTLVRGLTEASVDFGIVLEGALRL